MHSARAQADVSNNVIIVATIKYKGNWNLRTQLFLYILTSTGVFCTIDTYSTTIAAHFSYNTCVTRWSLFLRLINWDLWRVIYFPAAKKMRLKSTGFLFFKTTRKFPAGAISYKHQSSLNVLELSGALINTNWLKNWFSDCNKVL